MNRRDALLSSGAMALSASISALACGTRNAIAQAPHNHAGMAMGDATLIDAAYECSKKGEACIHHCLMLLAGGDTSMSGCAASVHDMVAVVDALAKLATANRKHMPAMARLAAEVCDDCESECRKHAETHVVCRECAESCAKTKALCLKLAG